MNIENNQRKVKANRIWGWISIVFGSLFTLVGIISLISAFSARDHELYQWLFLTCIWCLSIGIPLISLGKLWLTIAKVENSRRKWGWFSAIVGSLSAMFGIYSLILNLESLVKYGDWALAIVISVPPLMIGILGLGFGIREIIRKGKQSSTI